MGGECDEGGKAHQDVARFGSFERGEEGGADKNIEEKENEDGTSRGRAAEAKRAPQCEGYIENIEKEKEDGYALVHGVFLMHIPEREDVAGDGDKFNAGGKPDADGAPQRNREVCAQRVTNSAFAGDLREDGVFFGCEREILVIRIEDGSDTIAFFRSVKSRVRNVAQMDFLAI